MSTSGIVVLSLLLLLLIAGVCYYVKCRNKVEDKSETGNNNDQKEDGETGTEFFELEPVLEIRVSHVCINDDEEEER